VSVEVDMMMSLHYFCQVHNVVAAAGMDGIDTCQKLMTVKVKTLPLVSMVLDCLRWKMIVESLVLRQVQIFHVIAHNIVPLSHSWGKLVAVDILVGYFHSADMWTGGSCTSPVHLNQQQLSSLSYCCCSPLLAAPT
jgi:hypothetical protein